jgi:hypothetical protein
MKLKLILTTATVGVALAFPSISNAAPPPSPLQDSVVLTGAPAVVPAPTFDSTIFALNATSGPSGENPSGLVRFDTVFGHFHLGGPVTCLAVNGNTATISFPSQMDFPGDTITVEVVDDQPDTWAFADSTETEGRAPTDCSPLSGAPEVQRGPLSSGDFTVVDAQAPTTKDQCKNGGWHNYPRFKNQGQCVAFVNHRP